jgi:ADP-ribose pyrophosphatase YjhB (NUDIX family)
MTDKYKESHTAKAIFMRVRNEIPELLLFEHKVRKNTAKQKNGSEFKEKPRWGFSGGKVEEGESFVDAILREVAEETLAEDGTFLQLSPEMFSEELAVHGQVKRSMREGNDTHQDHYYFALLPSDTEIGKIRNDNEEIARGKYFTLDKIPTPDDTLPFTRNQLRGFVELLRHLRGKVENADRWLATVEKWAYPYLIVRQS